MPALLKSRPRRILAALLLLVYGCAGVLGYGLHALWHVHHGHAHQASASHDGHCHGHGCSHFQAAQCCDSHLASHKNAHLESVEDDCSICAFLAQAQTPLFEFTLTEVIADLGIEIPVSEDISPLYIPADHLARGPPRC